MKKNRFLTITLLNFVTLINCYAQETNSNSNSAAAQSVSTNNVPSLRQLSSATVGKAIALDHADNDPELAEQLFQTFKLNLPSSAFINLVKNTLETLLCTKLANNEYFAYEAVLSIAFDLATRINHLQKAKLKEINVATTRCYENLKNLKDTNPLYNKLFAVIHENTKQKAKIKKDYTEGILNVIQAVYSSSLGFYSGHGHVIYLVSPLQALLQNNDFAHYSWLLPYLIMHDRFARDVRNQNFFAYTLQYDPESALSPADATYLPQKNLKLFTDIIANKDSHTNPCTGTLVAGPLTGELALAAAIQKNDTPAAQKLIESGLINLNADNIFYGSTRDVYYGDKCMVPLVAATRYHNLALVKLLLTYEITTEIKGHAIIAAIENQDIDIIRVLLANITSLHCFTNKNELIKLALLFCANSPVIASIIELLAQAEAPVLMDDITANPTAANIIEQHPEIKAALARTPQGKIYYAKLEAEKTAKQAQELVQQFRANHEQENKAGETALSLASNDGKLAIVDILLS